MKMNENEWKWMEMNDNEWKCCKYFIIQDNNNLLTCIHALSNFHNDHCYKVVNYTCLKKRVFRFVHSLPPSIHQCTTM